MTWYHWDWNDRNERLVTGFTGTDGRYRLSGLEAGASVVVAEAGGFGLGGRRLVVTDEAPDHTVNVQLHEAVSAELQVVDPRGRPIGGARLLGLGWSAESGAAYLPADFLPRLEIDVPLSDAAGRLLLPALSAGGDAPRGHCTPEICRWRNH